MLCITISVDCWLLQHCWQPNFIHFMLRCRSREFFLRLRNPDDYTTNICCCCHARFAFCHARFACCHAHFAITYLLTVAKKYKCLMDTVVRRPVWLYLSVCVRTTRLIVVGGTARLTSAKSFQGWAHLLLIRPVVTEFDVKLALVDEDRRKAVYQDVIDMLEPINSVVFVCTKGWNRADLCRGFIQSLSVEDPLLIRYRLIHFVEIPSFCYKLQPQRALFNW